MSSRLLAPDDPRPIEPVVWRRIPQAVEPEEATPEPAPAEAPPEPPREPEVDLAEMERAWQGRVADARALGLREGEAAGKSRAMAELQPVFERLARSIDELAGLRPRLRREAEADMIQLAIAIARRILRREMAIDPEALHGLVLGALEKLQVQEISRVRVHPAQAASVAGLLRSRSSGLAIEVTPDPAAEPGGVVFETARGNLDASVESQLSEIERGLADTLRRQR